MGQLFGGFGWVWVDNMDPRTTLIQPDWSSPNSVHVFRLGADVAENINHQRQIDDSVKVHFIGV